MNPLDDFRRTLNKDNIDESIKNYLKILDSIDLSINADDALDFFNKIKRNKLKNGPYPKVTLFEAANRIMTDLTILYGVKQLLDNKIENILFDEYNVELGNEDNNNHDIEAKKDGKVLKGEAFNVANSFFQGKKAKSLKKLRKNKGGNDILLLMYNHDAPRRGKNYKPVHVENEYHLAVDFGKDFLQLVKQIQKRKEK